MLDTDWLALIEVLQSGPIEGQPLIPGGRSMGARVACRTAAEVSAVAVLCLAFPLEPPARAGKPRQSRVDELDAVPVPVLVVQGTSDRFGMPPPGPGRRVVKVPGDHGLKADIDAVRTAVGEWLHDVIPVDGASPPPAPHT